MNREQALAVFGDYKNRLKKEGSQTVTICNGLGKKEGSESVMKCNQLKITGGTGIVNHRG